ncbi:MAG: DUF1016 N-terminal domain-containing protein [Methanomicrobiales archaeon]|nr:DUF1016 N-terminal domain-containing protein [Methanomicrobiales archaeon]
MQALSAQLKAGFGEGFLIRNFFTMIRFAEVFPDEKIARFLIPFLSWTHHRQIIHREDTLKRTFYVEMCRPGRCSTRTLQQKIDSMLFERTARLKKPKLLASQERSAHREEDRMIPGLVFRDPGILDFLRLQDTYSVDDPESAIPQEMELYLRWLGEHARETSEGPPLGLILCAGADHEQIRLLQPDKSGIHIAGYLTELMLREVPEKKLRAVVAIARERLAARTVGELIIVSDGLWRRARKGARFGITVPDGACHSTERSA